MALEITGVSWTELGVKFPLLALGVTVIVLAIVPFAATTKLFDATPVLPPVGPVSVKAVAAPLFAV